MKKKLRHFWHELFYMLAPSSVQKFGMTCKEAVSQMDIKDENTSFLMWFRLKLHLSFCQACNNYFRASRALGRAIRKLMKGSETFDLERINDELLRKHTRPKDTKLT